MSQDRRSNSSRAHYGSTNGQSSRRGHQPEVNPIQTQSSVTYNNASQQQESSSIQVDNSTADSNTDSIGKDNTHANIATVAVQPCERTPLLHLHTSNNDTIICHPTATLPIALPFTPPPLHFHLYARRWYVLALFSLMAIINNSICFTLASVHRVSRLYFYGDHGHGHGHASKSGGGGGFGLASLVSCYFVTYVLFSFPSSWLIERWGLKAGVLVGGWLQTIGCALRVWATPNIDGNEGGSIWNDADSSGRSYHTHSTDSTTPHGNLHLFMVGQMIASLGQAFFVNPPPLLAATWFGVSERTLATTISVNANTLGIAVAYLVGPALVQTTHDLPRLVQWTAAVTLLCALMASIYFPAAPPTPPSHSQIACVGEEAERKEREIEDSIQREEREAAETERRHAAAMAMEMEQEQEQEEMEAPHMQLQSEHSSYQQTDTNRTEPGGSTHRSPATTSIAGSISFSSPLTNTTATSPDTADIDLEADHEGEDRLLLQNGTNGVTESDEGADAEMDEALHLNGQPPTISSIIGGMSSGIGGVHHLQPPSSLASHRGTTEEESSVSVSSSSVSDSLLSSPSSSPPSASLSSAPPPITVSVTVPPSTIPCAYAFVESIRAEKVRSRNASRMLGSLHNFKHMFATKGFMHTLLVFGISEALINMLSTFMTQIAAGWGYHSMQMVGLLVNAFIGSCMVGSALVGWIVDRNKQFKTWMLVSLFGSCFGLLYLIEFGPVSEKHVWVAVLLIGFFVGPLQPIAIETAVEVTYPVPESSVTAVEQVLGNLFSAALFPLIILCRPPVDQSMVPALYLLFFCVLSTAAIYASFHGIYQRLRHESVREKRHREVHRRLHQAQQRKKVVEMKRQNNNSNKNKKTKKEEERMMMKLNQEASHHGIQTKGAAAATAATTAAVSDLNKQPIATNSSSSSSMFASKSATQPNTLTVAS